MQEFAFYGATTDDGSPGRIFHLSSFNCIRRYSANVDERRTFSRHHLVKKASELDSTINPPNVPTVGHILPGGKATNTCGCKLKNSSSYADLLHLVVPAIVEVLLEGIAKFE